MSVVTGISGQYISAKYGPTNSADVSAIASAYAESAASGKQDSGSYLSSTDASAFYPSTANPSGYLTTLPADLVYSAELSSYAYESSNSGKLDKSAIECDTASAITAIGGSSIGGGGGGGVVTATASATASIRSGSTGVKTGTVTAVTSIDGNALASQIILPNAAQVNGSNILAFSPTATMWTTSTVAKGIFTALQYGTGAGLFMENGQYKGYIKGNEFYVANTAYGYARAESHGTRGNRMAVQDTYSGSAEMVALGGVPRFKLGNTAGTAEITISSIGNWNDTYNTVSSNSASWGGGGVDSATVSAIASAYQVVSSVGDDGTYITSINGSALSGAGGGGAASLPISGSGDDGYGNSATSTYSETGAEFVMTGSYSGSSYLSPSTLYLVHRQNSFTRPSTLVEANRIQLSDGNDTLSLDVATISGYSNAYNTVYNNSASWGGGTPVVTATAGSDGYITSINGSGISGAGGIDSATVSAIASSYTESAASSKMDGSAVQSAYASASSTQATANGVLYILIPDGA